jgi:hypothetical protein
MTQCEYLLKHFRSGKAITTLQAHREGITSLSKRICELRDTGHSFTKTWKTVKTRYGNGKARVVEYRIG